MENANVKIVLKDLPQVKAELQRLNDENLQMANLLNGLADFIEEISVDFSNFTFKDDAREEWQKWCTAYVNRPCQVKITRCLDCGAPITTVVDEPCPVCFPYELRDDFMWCCGGCLSMNNRAESVCDFCELPRSSPLTGNRCDGLHEKWVKLYNFCPECGADFRIAN